MKRVQEALEILVKSGSSQTVRSTAKASGPSCTGTSSRTSGMRKNIDARFEARRLDFLDKGYLAALASIPQVGQGALVLPFTNVKRVAIARVHIQVHVIAKLSADIWCD